MFDKQNFGSFGFYSAKISQTGTDDPVLSIAANSIGEIVWTRIDTGNFEGALTGAFPGITICSANIYGDDSSTPRLAYLVASDGNTLSLRIFDTTGNPVDEIGAGSSIDIKTYPA